MHAACTSHNAQIQNDNNTSGPPEPDSACADEIHYSLDDDAWLADAFADHSNTRGRIDHLRSLLDIEELYLDELEDAINANTT